MNCKFCGGKMIQDQESEYISQGSFFEYIPGKSRAITTHHTELKHICTECDCFLAVKTTWHEKHDWREE